MTEDRLVRMQQKILKVIQEEMQGWTNDLLQGMLDPSKLMDFIRAMGFDPSRLPGVMSRQASFDPYQVLGLDKSASDEEVKKRYRELLYKLHPDTAGAPGTSFLFQLVMAAYNMIKMQRGWQ